MSRQDVEKQLSRVRDQESTSRVFAIGGFASFASGMIVNFQANVHHIIDRYGELTSGTGQIVEGATLGALFGIGVVGAIRAISHGQTAAALEGVLAQDQLNAPEPTSEEASPEEPTE